MSYHVQFSNISITLRKFKAFSMAPEILVWSPARFYFTSSSTLCSSHTSILDYTGPWEACFLLRFFAFIFLRKSSSLRHWCVLVCHIFQVSTPVILEQKGVSWKPYVQYQSPCIPCPVCSWCSVSLFFIADTAIRHCVFLFMCLSVSLFCSSRIAGKLFTIILQYLECKSLFLK